MAINKNITSLVLFFCLVVGVVIGVSIKTSQQKSITPNAPSSKPLAGAVKSCGTGLQCVPAAGTQTSNDNQPIGSEYCQTDNTSSPFAWCCPAGYNKTYTNSAWRCVAPGGNSGGGSGNSGGSGSGSGSGNGSGGGSQTGSTSKNSCNEECPGDDGVLRSCANGGEQSLCNRAGRVEACGGRNFCCPTVGGAWTTNMTACNTCNAKAATTMSVENISSTSVKLKWSGASGGIIRLWVSKNANPTGNCGTGATCVANDVRPASTANEYTLTNLTVNTTYYWRIMTWKEAGCDDSSSVANFTTAETTCTDTTWTPNPNTVCVGTNLTQTSNCGTTRQTAGTKTDGACVVCTDTTWTPNPNTVCLGTSLTQTSNCGTTRQTAGTKTDTTWSPDPNLTCAGESFSQTGDCGGTRQATGTKNCCVDTTWSPSAANTCSDQKFVQTSNCGNNREIDGTKTCPAELSVTSKVYQDDARNKPGIYYTDKQITKVSRDQFMVYTMEVKNSGTGGAKNVKVTDTLTGQNQNILAFVDSEDKCKFDHPTKKLTCEISNIAAKGMEKIKFRVKVAQTAINGKIIRNTAKAVYKDRTKEGSVETLLSSIVSCNEFCNSDSECVGGLACDVFSNKCRKPSCLKDTTCGCLSPTATATIKPTTTLTATVTKIVTPTDEVIGFPDSSELSPTTSITLAEAPDNLINVEELPTTGIFELPQAAVFGGGILLAIVGIFLAL